MPTYRVYTIGQDGRFANAKEIECADDQAAIQQAGRLVDGRDVEVWERGRFIARCLAHRR